MNTCGPQDRIVLATNFDVQTVPLDLTLRASGIGLTWPVDPEHTLNTTWTGTLLITLQIINNEIRYDSPEVDVRLFAAWNDTWPNTTSNLFPRIPIHAFLSELAAETTLKFQKQMPRLQDLIRKAPQALTCKFVDTTTATCSSGLFVPVSCSPCDTCCECAMQQKCDGECEKCPCINCNYNQTNLLVISALMLLSSWLILP
jgi:hypothetical protein